MVEKMRAPYKWTVKKVDMLVSVYERENSSKVNTSVICVWVYGCEIR